MNNTANFAYTFNGTPHSGSDSATTDIIIATPKPSVAKSVSRDTVQPTDSLHFYNEVRNGNGTLPLVDPVWADLLPAELEYTAGSFSVGNAFSPFVPANLEVITNYKGTGRTLLRYTATGVSIDAFNNGAVAFDAVVKPGTIVGSYSNTSYLVKTSSPALNTEFAPPVADANDLNDDGSSIDNIYPSNPTPFNVIRYAAMDSYKSVKGELDASFNRFPTNGFTNSGGTFVYKVTVTNPGNVPLKNIKLLDILPFVGDIGVKVTSATRDSEWTPYLTSAVAAPVGVTVSYSTSRNPKRSDLDASLGDPTSGSGTFSTTAPGNLTTVGSLMFDFGAMVLNPLETKELTWTMTAPPNVIPGEIAWNSFAFRADATDGGLAPPPTEPIKVGVTVPAAATALIGDYAWIDTNGNGIQDETGTGISGLLVTLCDQNGNPVLDVAGNPVTTTTDSSGYYQFGVPPGTYSVKFNSPPGYGPTLQNAAGSTTANDSNINSSGKTGNVTVAAGEQNLTLDAGFANFANLGNLVFCDVNNNGVRDLPADVGIQGVQVALFDATGTNPIDNPNLAGAQDYVLTTDINGNYMFVNLLPGTYTVKILTPPVDKPASSTTTPGGDNNDNGTQSIVGGPITSAPVTINPGQTDTTVDFGLFAPAALGNLVFCDLNNNGIRDLPDDVGIQGVQLTLCDLSGTPVDDPNIAGVQNYVVTTDINGAYQFVNLTPGDYMVKIITPPSSKLTNSTPTPGGDNKDNGTQVGFTGVIASGVVHLNPGEVNNTLDFGLLQLANLGNQVFCDHNNNGIKDAGDEGVSGVSVSLWSADGSTPVDNPNIAGTQDYVVNTDSNGIYQFVNLVPGTYVVKILTPPVGKPASSTVDSPADNNIDDNDNGLQSSFGATITSGPVTLSPGETDNTVDFGLFLPAHIGNYVWLDTNNNGLVDGGETPINGVTVQLFKAGQNPLVDAPFMSAVTTGGLYNFDVPTGDYFVCIPTSNFVRATGALATSPTSSTGADVLDDQVNNNDNGVQTGGPLTAVKSVVIHLDEGETDHTIDFGFVPLQICGKVFHDENDLKDQLVNGTDPNLSGQLYMNLIEGGLVVQTVPVPATGLYNFTGIYPNVDYTLVLTSTPGVVGQPAPAPSLPAPYVNTGEVIAPATPHESETDGILPVHVGSADVCNADFGIDVAKPSIKLEKTGYIDLGSNGQVEATDLIRYTFKVTNTGNVRLTNVTISDPTATSILGGPIAMLEVNAIDTTTFTGTYSITAADLTAKTHSNTATVTGTDPKNNPVRDNSTHVEDLSLYQLCGSVFMDATHNGILDGSDIATANVRVYLFLDRDNDGTPDGPAITSMLTSASSLTGNAIGYCFPNLPVGHYITCQAGYPGASNVTDVDGNANGANCVQSQIIDRDVVNRDFLLDVVVHKICGQVLDGKIPELGTTIQLFNSDGVKIGETTTDAKGNYCFLGIPDGNYKVCEINPPGVIGGTDIDNGDPDCINVTVAGTDKLKQDFVDLRTIPVRNAATYCCTTILVNPLRDLPPGTPNGTWSVVSVTQGAHGTATIEPDGRIKYVPNSKSQFYGSMSDTIIVTLRDSSGLIITRTIDIHSFESISGSFNGLLQPEDLVNPDADPADFPEGANGFFTVTLSKNAGVTGSVVLEDKTYALSGGLTGPLTFAKIFTVSPGVTRTITLIYDDVSDSWSGRVATTSINSRTSGDLVGNARRKKTNTADIAGTYNVALSPTGSTDTNGYARVTIGTTGVVSVSGEQAWGGTWTASSFVRKDGTIAIYRAPGAVTLAKRQLFAIILDTTSTAISRELTGAADWRYKDASYGAPVLTTTPIALDLFGSKYTAIASTASLLGAPGTLSLAFNNGITTTNINATTANNVTTQIGTLASDVFKLTVNRSTGVWTGTITRGITAIPMKGVTLQTRHEATGFGPTVTLPYGNWHLIPQVNQ